MIGQVKPPRDTVCGCPSRMPARSRSDKGALSFLGSLVILLLPKCSFCLLAYSSAITMCSGQTLYDHHTGPASYISIGLVLLVLISLLFNFRGPRTIFAIGLTIAGGCLVAISELHTGQLSSYQTGAFLILTGAFLNGSVFFFIKKIITSLRHGSSQWIGKRIWKQESRI